MTTTENIHQLHIMLLAGEASGDARGAEVVTELKKIRPDVYCSGMGTTEMKRAGVDVFYDCSSIAVVGIVEILKHWGDIKQAMKLVREKLETTRPDLLVLIDYPEFNLRMARHARALGIRVLFYISPQVWAWRPKRVKKIGQSIDHMAVIFKFETDFYQQHDIPVSFVGHPLVDKVRPTAQVKGEKQRLGIPAECRVVGLFPGSRNSEISRLLPLMLETASLMQQQDPQLHFVLPVAATLDYTQIEQQCSGHQLNLSLTRDNLYDVISNCDAIVSCSGTVTLEIALLGVPYCIVYKISWLSYQIMSRLIRIEHIGLANIVANRKVVEELLQHRATPQNISDELLRLLNDQDYRQQIRDGLDLVRQNLGQAEGARRMAGLILEQANLHND